MYASFTPEQLILGYSAAIVGFGVLATKSLPFLSEHVGRKWSFRRRYPRGAASIRIGSLVLTDDERMRHTHIVGATGTGKTVLVEQLLFQDLDRGYGALIIDPKGERDFYQKVRRYCDSIGRSKDLHLLSATHLEESVLWNPCRLGDVSELQSKFFCAAKYEHSFYAKAAELALLQAFKRLVKDRPDAITLLDLVDGLNSLSNDGKDENLKGLYFDIQNLALGEWSGVLGAVKKPGVQSEVSLLDVIRKNEILFVDLPTEGKSVQSARVGSLLLQELTLISGLRKRFPALKSNWPFSVYVDEFDAFATEPFVTFLNKGRSSEFMIHMAHQTLSDLSKVSPTFQGQVMGNPNVRFIFRMDVAQDAELIARQFGTKLSVKRTFQTLNGSDTGTGSKREAQEFRIHPDVIKELGVGECIVGIKTARYLEKFKVPRMEAPPASAVIQRKELAAIRAEKRLSPRPMEELSTYQGLLPE